MKTNMEYTRMFKKKHPDATIVSITIINGKVRAKSSQYVEYYPLEEPEVIADNLVEYVNECVALQEWAQKEKILKILGESQ